MLPPLLADMNIAVPAIEYLRRRGVDVVSAREEGWHTWSDSELMFRASQEQRFVLTQDSDFGRLAIHRGEAYHGILYLRPGGRPPSAVIADLQELLSAEVIWPTQAIVVYQSGRLRVRVPEPQSVNS